MNNRVEESNLDGKKPPIAGVKARNNRLRRRIGIASFFALTILLILSLILHCLGYYGPKSFTACCSFPPVEFVIQNAKKLKGTPYDPLMGRYNDIGGRLGFIVCSDIPIIAYGLSGLSWKEMLERDFAKHATYYDTRNGNTPRNTYFHRRARNLYSYFVANQRLVAGTDVPNRGDLAFYRKGNHGRISHVALVTEVSKTGYRVMESAPKTVFAREVDQDSPRKRGWILVGFGRVYD